MGRKVHSTDGFGFKGWMVTDLQLKGGDLIAFALVHQFSQSDAGIYTGNTEYLASWTGWTDKTAREHLHHLAELGLIEEIRENNNKVNYRLGKRFYEWREGQKKLPTMSEKITDHSGKKLPDQVGKNYRQNIIIESNKESKENISTPTPSSFTELGKSTPQKLQGGSTIHHKNQPMEKPSDGESNRWENHPMETPTHSSFTPPTFDQVVDYCKSRGFADPEGFADYYLETSSNNGWRKKDGTPVTNWKNNVLVWEKYHKDEIFPKRRPVTAARTVSTLSPIYR